MADPDDEKAGGSSGGYGPPPPRLPGETLEQYQARLFKMQPSNAPALQKIAALLARYPGAELVDETHVRMPNGKVRSLQANAAGEPTLSEEWTVEASKAYLNSLDAGGSGSGGGSSSRLATDDPRYWEMQAAQLGLDWAKLDQDDRQFVQDLAARMQNNGLDAESARQQALAQMKMARDSNATNLAQTSADVAKTAAEFAANPRDTYAEGMYRAQTGGVPFGDIRNQAFGEYGKALASKAESIFQPVSEDLNRARTYRDSIPPLEFMGTDVRQQLQLAPTPAGALAAGTTAGTSLPAAPAPAPNTDLQGALQFINAVQNDPRGQEGFAADLARLAPPPPAVDPRYKAADPSKLPSWDKGGKINFDGIFDGRARDGFSPSSSEGGTNLNIHERAVIVGESGQVYGTLGERRPDGSVRAEQLQIKPLKSEVAKDKKLEEAKKAKVETQKNFLASFDQGGTATFGGTGQQKYDLFEMLMKQLGGAGGGTSDPFGGARQLAGLEDELDADPYLKAATEATYSQMGVRPEQLWAGVAKYRPNSAQLVGQTRPRVNYI